MEKCARCGGPSYNVNGAGEPTGQHRALEECVRELVARVAKLEPGPACVKCLRRDCGGITAGCRICGECERRTAGAAHGPGLCGDTTQCELCKGFLMTKHGTIGNHGRGLCVTMDRNGRVVRPKKGRAK